MRVFWARVVNLALIARRSLVEILWIDDPRMLVLGTGCLTLTLGWFLLRSDDALGGLQAYTFMAVWGDTFWGLLFVGVGLSKILACLFNRCLMSRNGWRWVPFWLNVASGIMWVIVWSGIYLSNRGELTMGSIIYGALWINPFFCAVRRFKQAWESRVQYGVA